MRPFVRLEENRMEKRMQDHTQEILDVIIGVDPAVASGPLITTINDLVAVVTYYGLG